MVARMEAEAAKAERRSGERSRQGGAAVRVPPPLVFVVLIAAGLVVHFWVHRLPIGLALAPRLVVGGLLVATGVAVGLIAIGDFKRSGRPNPLPWHPSPELLAQGPYRFSRNPMYLFETVQMIGIGIASNCAWVVVLAPVFLAIVHFTAVLPEERYLAETFGESYERYRAKVRRYL
jgi:protein-S-isoprenylcysteine O-methyltransferase Ste14